MILFVSASPRARECVQFLEQATQKTTVLCASVRAAFSLCQGGEFLIVVLDQASIDAGPGDPSAIPRGAETVLAVYVNTVLMGPQRVANEVRGAIQRLEYERILAMQQAGALVRNEVRTEITGILLAAGLALAATGLSPLVATKLRDIQKLADRMRQRIDAGIPRHRNRGSARQPPSS